MSHRVCSCCGYDLAAEKLTSADIKNVIEGFKLEGLGPECVGKGKEQKEEAGVKVKKETKVGKANTSIPKNKPIPKILIHPPSDGEDEDEDDEIVMVKSEEDIEWVFYIN